MSRALRRTAVAFLISLTLPIAAQLPVHAAPIPAVTAVDGAHVVAEQQVAPRQVDLTIASPALGTTAKVRLLTPDGWGTRRPGRH